LLLNLAYAACVSAIWIAVLVYGIVKWRQVREVFLVGLLVGLGTLLLRAPSVVLGVVYLDLTALIPGHLQDASGLFVQMVFLMTVVLSLLIAIVGAFHLALQIAVGQLATQPAQGYPTLLGDRVHRFRGWGLAAVLGSLAGIASTLLFWALDVQIGETVRMAQKLMPGLETAPTLLVVGTLLLAFVAIAVAEEVLFRGVLQGWITRLLGGERAAAALAIVSATLIWTLGHAGNAEPLWLKLCQIFLLGLLFGWMAYRYSVEAAIVAHVGLNVSALLVAYALGLSL
jgi:membrane protease YdiL (CAAX protease family)